MITCGSCEQKHETVDQVRACYGAPKPATTPKPNVKLISPKMIKFVDDLLFKLGQTREQAGLVGLEGMPMDQAHTVLDALIDKAKQAPKPTHTEKKHDGSEPKPGTYTLVRPDGSYRTLQFAHAKWADGRLVASFLCGSDNTADYKGFAFVDGGKVGVWKKFKDDSQLVQDLNTFLGLTNQDSAHELFLQQAEAFALASGKCMRCGHKLTVPTSLYRGLGPVCADIEGVA